MESNGMKYSWGYIKGHLKFLVELFTMYPRMKYTSAGVSALLSNRTRLIERIEADPEEKEFWTCYADGTFDMQWIYEPCYTPVTFMDNVKTGSSMVVGKVTPSPGMTAEFNEVQQKLAEAERQLSFFKAPQNPAAVAPVPVAMPVAPPVAPPMPPSTTRPYKERHAQDEEMLGTLAYSSCLCFFILIHDQCEFMAALIVTYLFFHTNPARVYRRDDYNYYYFMYHQSHYVTPWIMYSTIKTILPHPYVSFYSTFTSPLALTRRLARVAMFRIEEVDKQGYITEYWYYFDPATFSISWGENEFRTESFRAEFMRLRDTILEKIYSLEHLKTIPIAVPFYLSFQYVAAEKKIAPYPRLVRNETSLAITFDRMYYTLQERRDCMRYGRLNVELHMRGINLYCRVYGPFPTKEDPHHFGLFFDTPDYILNKYQYNEDLELIKPAEESNRRKRKKNKQHEIEGWEDSDIWCPPVENGVHRAVIMM